jgi:hypothetical protein
MKMRMIKLTPELLMERLQGKTSSVTSNLPSDTELLDIKYDLFSGQVLAIVRSESFEDTAEAYPIPEFNVTYSANPKTAPASAAVTPKLEPKPTATLTVKPEQKTAASPKLESSAVKKMQVQPKQNSSLMEEEFSQEQRKLLSFTVDKEYLVVKPVKFLKAEWDDINEVVRSLGGRWVKGSIISYWEIPLQQT